MSNSSITLMFLLPKSTIIVPTPTHNPQQNSTNNIDDLLTKLKKSIKTDYPHFEFKVNFDVWLKKCISIFYKKYPHPSFSEEIIDKTKDFIVAFLEADKKINGEDNKVKNTDFITQMYKCNYKDKFHKDVYSKQKDVIKEILENDILQYVTRIQYRKGMPTLEQVQNLITVCLVDGKLHKDTLKYVAQKLYEKGIPTLAELTNINNEPSLRLNKKLEEESHAIKLKPSSFTVLEIKDGCENAIDIDNSLDNIVEVPNKLHKELEAIIDDVKKGNKNATSEDDSIIRDAYGKNELLSYCSKIYGEAYNMLNDIDQNDVLMNNDNNGDFCGESSFSNPIEVMEVSDNDDAAKDDPLTKELDDIIQQLKRNHTDTTELFNEIKEKKRKIYNPLPGNIPNIAFDLEDEDNNKKSFAEQYASSSNSQNQTNSHSF